MEGLRVAPQSQKIVGPPRGCQPGGHNRRHRVVGAPSFRLSSLSMFLEVSVAPSPKGHYYFAYRSVEYKCIPLTRVYIAWILPSGTNGRKRFVSILDWG